MDWKLELVAIPVSDVDRAKAFYADQVGFAVEYQGVETVRTTTITRDGNVVKQSAPSPIKRT